MEESEKHQNGIVEIHLQDDVGSADLSGGGLEHKACLSETKACTCHDDADEQATLSLQARAPAPAPTPAVRAPAPRNGRGRCSVGCILPRSSAFDESEAPTAQYVFFVRHAESRWNAAQEQRSLLGMYQEFDHGLSETGWRQALLLRDKVDAKLTEMKQGRLQRNEWLQRFLKPQFVCTSPFTRAIETALVGFGDLLFDHGELVVSKAVREQKNFGGVDSVGIAVGDHIIPRVKSELTVLYTDTQSHSELQALLQRIEELDIDVSDVKETWWTSLVESDAEVAERLEALFLKLRSLGVGSTAIVVGHSHMFRRLFRTYMAEDTKSRYPKLVASLQEHIIPNCGVVGCAVDWDLRGTMKITDVALLLGTNVQEATPNQSMSHKEAECAAAGREIDTAVHYTAWL